MTPFLIFIPFVIAGVYMLVEWWFLSFKKPVDAKWIGIDPKTDNALRRMQARDDVVQLVREMVSFDWKDGSKTAEGEALCQRLVDAGKEMVEAESEEVSL